MIHIRRARPGEGAIVAARIRSSLPKQIVGLTIWDCLHVDRWVESHFDSKGASVFYLAVDDSSGIVGAAEFRIVDQTVFLNQIGVCESHQGRHAGGRLMAAGLRDLGSAQGLVSAALDVDPANHDAYEWYQRLGFSSGPLGHWMLQTPRLETVEPAAVEGWEEAQREHKCFGFSQLELRSAGERHVIGRLGDALFRITTDEVWNDPAVHAALDHLDAGRRVLLILDAPVQGAEPVRCTERLRAPVTAVLSKLPSP
jgi:hypothetical protein